MSTISVIADDVEYKHPIIIYADSFCAFGVDPAAFDDGMVYPVVQLSVSAVHIKTPPSHNPKRDHRAEVAFCQDGSANSAENLHVIMILTAAEAFAYLRIAESAADNAD